MKYQKKPVTIEAVQFLGIDAKNHFSERPDWLVEALDNHIIRFYSTHDKLAISTLEGTMHASVGDYIICGVHDEIYSCAKDIFEETYRVVKEG